MYLSGVTMPKLKPEEPKGKAGFSAE